MILIDTSPLVALCDGRDGRHAESIADLAAFGREALATCDAVLTETCFHLPHAHQRRRVQALLRELDVRILPETIDDSLWNDVFEWLGRYADHEPDWADGCLAVLSGRDRALKVWTHDREFGTIWRRSDGTAIPTAARSVRARRPSRRRRRMP